MSCQKIERYLRDNPGSPLPSNLESHLAECRECAGLWRQQSALSGLLKDMPRADMPDRLATGILERFEGQKTGPARMILKPYWLTMAAPAMALIVAVSALIMRYEYIAKNPIQSAGLAPASTAGKAGPIQAVPTVSRSQIYPVWPADEEVISREDLAIMASLYPDHQGKAKLFVDGQDVSASSTIDRQHISYDPKAMEAGEHVVKVMLQQADGSYQTASWSFYLLEERS